MISIGKISSVEQAVRYLREAVTQHQLEYFTARGESPGRWNGDAAEALGLRGEVTDDDFTAVLSGRHPRTGADLGKHWGAQRVVAFDVAVSAPKDVSILYALGDEPTRATLLRIHAEGVRAAVEYLQANAGWARQRNPQTKVIEPVRATMLMPEFVHRTARPVTNPGTGVVTVDPQLHTHITVPAWVQRPDGSWSQLYSEALYQHAAAAGAIAQAEWRDRLVRELGVSTVVDGKGCFSIVGISDAQRREFSRRSLQIDAAAALYGVESSRGREVATLDTRESKHEVAATEDLFAQWRARAASVGLDRERLRLVVNREPSALAPRRLDVATAADILGVRGITAQRATFTRRDLIRAVASHAPLGVGRGQLEAVVDRILADNDTVVALAPATLDPATAPVGIAKREDPGHEVRYTTPEMLALEQGMLHTARARANAGDGVAQADHVERAVAGRDTLTEDQRRMIRTVCSSPAGVIVVEGAAGVGKTYALEACREAFEQSGVAVVGCAVAGRAAEVLEEGSRIESRTIMRMLHRLEREPLPAGAVLVVDEAGMIGDRQLAELVSLAARDQAKLVVVGDPQQLQAIDAGAPMRMLGEHIGKVDVRENVRTAEAWERRALEMIRDGDARQAFQEYARRHRMHFAPTAPTRDQAVIADYTRLAADGLDVVMLAQRRDEVGMLNELARTAALQAERLSGPALCVDGKPYQVGDRVLCLANDHAIGVSNGTRGMLTAVDVEHQTLTLKRFDQRQLSIDTARYDAIERGYALTVHKAQGMTADVALVVGSDSATREWAYTAMSRGTLATHYYDVDRPASRDPLGIRHAPAPVASVEARIVQSWARSVQQDAALDYELLPERARQEREPIWLLAPATGAQRAVLADRAAPALGEGATRLEAQIAIERSAEAGCRPHRIEELLRAPGVPERAIREFMRSVADESDLASAIERVHAAIADSPNPSFSRRDPSPDRYAIEREYARAPSRTPGPTPW